MKVALERDNILEHWQVKVIVGVHNHEPSADPSAYFTYRITALDPQTTAQIKSLVLSGLNNAQILTVVRQNDPSAILISRDISNMVQLICLEQLNGKSPME